MHGRMPTICSLAGSREGLRSIRMSRFRMTAIDATLPWVVATIRRRSSAVKAYRTWARAASGAYSRRRCSGNTT
jgi:hypothetical protein